MDEAPARRTYLLIDGENLDATLGVNVLQHRPLPEERPRWEKVLTFTQQLWDQPVTGLFFLNASSGHLPMSFVQALTAIGYRSVPLSGPADVKVVDVGIQRTLDAIVPRDADVVLGSHDIDFVEQVRTLLATEGRRVALLGFTEYMSTGYADLHAVGLGTYDLEHDAKAFNKPLPRIRILDIESFDPVDFPVTAPVEVRVDGRVLLAFDAGPADAADTVMWHHGTPQTGAPLPPVVEAANARGMRVISYARPGYGSTAVPGRDVASAADDAVAVADVFGVQRFFAAGASGGGPHALAGGALRPDRIAAVVCLAGIAPLTDEFDWWDGMVAPGGLLAAVAGRDARAQYERTAEFDPASFVERDYDALRWRWASLGQDAGRGGEIGFDGSVDDDVAFVTPWGFSLLEVGCSALFVQGGADRVVPPAHARHQAVGCPQGELWERPRDGHVSVLDAVGVAFDWLLDGG